MLNILSAISTETIIGIVAIIVIVISAGIIIATAIRNFLLHKKAMIEAEKNEGFGEDFEVQEIESDEQTENTEVSDITVTAEEAEQGNNISEVPAEFAEEEGEVEDIQEINFENKLEKPDENIVDNGLEDIDKNEVKDNSMDELLEKLANRQ